MILISFNASGASAISAGTKNSTIVQKNESEESDCGHVTNVYVTGGAVGPQGERGLRGEPGPRGIKAGVSRVKYSIK